MMTTRRGAKSARRAGRSLLPAKLLVGVAGLVVLSVATTARAGILLGEALGNFMDAVAVTAEFGAFTNLNINGDTINATGFLFTVNNTSWGDGMSSSFANGPNGLFGDGMDNLTAAAAAAIAGRQPFGMYAFGAELPTGAGVITSAPAGFALTIQPNPPGMPPGMAVEVNFTIDLSTPRGLLFDPNAMGIDPLFTNLQTGKFSFFISTVSSNIFDNLLDEDQGLPAINIMSSMAWAEGGIAETIFSGPGVTGEPFDGAELRPRGQMVIPAPSTLLAIGLAGLVFRRRRRPA